MHGDTRFFLPFNIKRARSRAKPVPSMLPIILRNEPRITVPYPSLHRPLLVLMRSITVVGPQIQQFQIQKHGFGDFYPPNGNHFVVDNRYRCRMLDGSLLSYIANRG